MNLVLLPRDPAAWQPLAPGAKRRYAFPAGIYEFVGANDAAIGDYQVCSLFSPLLEFDDHASARLVATLAREALFDPANAEVPDVPVANLSPAATPKRRAGPLAQLAGAARCAAVEARFPARALHRGRAMTIEGELTVRLDWDGRRVTGVDVRSTRPFAATRILAGKTPAAAAATVPKLFAICGGAQGAAAASALAAAGAAGVDADAGAQRARRGAGGGAGILLAPADRLAAGDGRASRSRRRWPRVRHRIAAAARAADGRSALGDPAAMRALGAELSRHRGAVDLRHAARRVARAARRCARSKRGSRAARPSARSCSGGCSRRCRRSAAATCALMPAPRGDALLARHRARARPRPGLRARADVGRPAGRDRRAGARARASARGGARRHAAGTRRRRAYVARLVDLALLLGELGGSPRPATRCRWVQAFAVGEGGRPRRGADRARPAHAPRAHRRRPRRRLPDRRADRVELPSGGRAGARSRRHARRRARSRCSGRRASRCRRSIPASRAASRSPMHEMAIAESVLRDRRGDGARQRGGARVDGVARAGRAVARRGPTRSRFCFDAVDARQPRRGRGARDRHAAGRGLVHAVRRPGRAARSWASPVRAAAATSSRCSRGEEMRVKEIAIA